MASYEASVKFKIGHPGRSNALRMKYFDLLLSNLGLLSGQKILDFIASQETVQALATIYSKIREKRRPFTHKI